MCYDLAIEVSVVTLLFLAVPPAPEKLFHWKGNETMNMFKKNGGFTLVELIVVIAILAILAGVAIPAYSGYINKANEASDMQMLGAVKTAAVFEAVENDEGHDCNVTDIKVTKSGEA